MHNYLLYYGLILPLSILPFPVLYFISDIIYGLMFYCFGYRKKVVFQNLKNSFPEMTDAERKRIAKRFYHHLCDLIVESIKIFTISEKQIKKRFVATNPEVVTPFYEAGKSFVMVGGHYNNWELFAVAVSDHMQHDMIAIYKELKNKFFDRKMKKTRGRYGLRMVPTYKVGETFRAKHEKPVSIIFGSDQSPSKAKNAYWMEFLNQETGVLYGAEKYSREFDMPAVYGGITKLKRGHYQITYKVIEANSAESEYGSITEKHTRLLEEDIRRAPEFWLWTHKRWKRKKPEDARNTDPLKLQKHG